LRITAAPFRAVLSCRLTWAQPPQLTFRITPFPSARRLPCHPTWALSRPSSRSASRRSLPLVACSAHLPFGCSSSAAGLPGPDRTVSRPSSRCAFRSSFPPGPLPASAAHWMWTQLSQPPQCTFRITPLPSVRHRSLFCPYRAPQLPQCMSRNARLPLVICCPGGGLGYLTASFTPVDAVRVRPPVRVFFWHVRPGGTDPGL